MQFKWRTDKQLCGVSVDMLKKSATVSFLTITTNIDREVLPSQHLLCKS